MADSMSAMTEGDNYAPEMRARDAVIAEAMGTHQWVTDSFGQFLASNEEAEAIHKMKRFRDQDTSASANLPDPPRQIFDQHPRFHSDDSASRALLEWLAADEDRWIDFVRYFLYLGEYIPTPIHLLAKVFMLATPAQIAQAAYAMITAQPQSHKQK